MSNIRDADRPMSEDSFETSYCGERYSKVPADLLHVVPILRVRALIQVFVFGCKIPISHVHAADIISLRQ